MTNLRELEKRLEEETAWRPVPGWPYEASNTGLIRSLRTGKILRPGVTSKGYEKVTLQVDNQRTDMRVHRAVAAAWMGESELAVNHLNGKKDDNRPENLEYCTARENMRHAAITGLAAFGDRNGVRTKPHRTARGERSGAAKLTAAQVLEIRAARAKGEALKTIADRYGVTWSLIGKISKRVAWAHI